MKKMTRNMRKYGSKNEKLALLNRLPNAIAPASRCGKGVPGKGGATTNYDATMNDAEIRRIIRGKEEHR